MNNSTMEINVSGSSVAVAQDITLDRQVAGTVANTDAIRVDVNGGVSVAFAAGIDISSVATSTAPVQNSGSIAATAIT